MFQTKFVEKIKTHIFMVSNFFFFENHAVYETIWKNIVGRGVMPPMKIWLISIECWIPKATNTHSEYVILIAFPCQQW
jgi:hypothetical protein